MTGPRRPIRIVRHYPVIRRFSRTLAGRQIHEFRTFVDFCDAVSYLRFVLQLKFGPDTLTAKLPPDARSARRQATFRVPEKTGESPNSEHRNRRRSNRARFPFPVPELDKVEPQKGLHRD